MKNFIKILIFSLFAIGSYAQQATEFDSKSVKLPRYANLAAITNITTGITTPTQGMMVYNIETASNWYYNGTAWKDMAVSSMSVPSPLYLTSTGTTIAGETNQADEAGVMGINTTTGVGYAVLGKTTSTNPDENTVGVKGENMSTNGVGYGVMGRHEGTGWAGYFEGYNALKTQGNTYLNGDVGIGTDSPFGKLTVNTQSVGWNFPSLLLIDDATDNTGGAILQFRNPADKRMYLQSHFGTQSDGSDTYMTFSHNAFYNMRLRGDGNLGIGSLNPNLAGLVVNKKVGNSHAIFGDNTSGVSIESNFPGIHFNSYYNGNRKTMSTGYTAGAEMNPTTGDFSIYTSPASTSAGATAAVYERLKITKEGEVHVQNSVNILGEIKNNGVGGASGQMLQNNGNGTMSWVLPTRAPITITDTLTLSPYGLISEAIRPPFEIDQLKLYGYPTTGGQGLYYAPIVFPVSKLVINEMRAYMFDNNSESIYDLAVEIYSAPINSISITDRVSIAGLFSMGQSSVLQEKIWTPSIPYPVAMGKNTYFFRVRTLSSTWPANNTVGFRALRIIYSYTF